MGIGIYTLEYNMVRYIFLILIRNKQLKAIPKESRPGTAHKPKREFNRIGYIEKNI